MFWMYWDGNDQDMPFAWGSHDLWFYNGSFGFNINYPRIKVAKLGKILFP
jgi:hypothetical protein